MSTAALSDFHQVMVFSVFGVKKKHQKALLFIGAEAIMAESETSSSILSTWLAPEQQFEKVVLWPTPKAGSVGRPRMSGIPGVSGLGGFLGCGP